MKCVSLPRTGSSRRATFFSDFLFMDLDLRVCVKFIVILLLFLFLYVRNDSLRKYKHNK